MPAGAANPSCQLQATGNEEIACDQENSLTKRVPVSPDRLEKPAVFGPFQSVCMLISCYGKIQFIVMQHGVPPL